ncbi:preprotein translocase subunit SecE [Streptococcus massiliensis]|uniref:Preprotein translocase subunit SecE n=1 Tax=Streptococcus massiliensis TaxID=313439 RepID=A0A380L3M4_9STRE|nr:preprotein translocase subunit SecE [Streptococcus massiliensis]SUN77120.1 preprotein translocase subunit SecE [Streptococcus massiliensis]
MKFISETIQLLKQTTWPTKKERWKNFWSVMEYTAFFAVIIYIFDQIVSHGLLRVLNLF